MTLGLLAGTPDAALDAPSIQAPALMEVLVAQTPATPNAPHADLFRRGDQGLPILVPTTSIYVCDLEPWNPCDPGCLCLFVAGQVQCRC